MGATHVTVRIRNPAEPDELVGGTVKFGEPKAEPVLERHGSGVRRSLGRSHHSAPAAARRPPQEAPQDVIDDSGKR